MSSKLTQLQKYVVMDVCHAEGKKKWYVLFTLVAITTLTPLFSFCIPKFERESGNLVATQIHVTDSPLPWPLPNRQMNADKTEFRSPRSAMACVLSTCVFRDVCIRQSLNSSRGNPLIEHWGGVKSFPLALSIIDRIDHPLTTLYVTPTFLTENELLNESISIFRKGLTVLASYYGAENFGHHLFDNWNQFGFLREIGFRAMHAKRSSQNLKVDGSGREELGRATLLIARGCVDYDYSPAGHHLSRTEFAVDCARHQARFFPLSDFGEILMVPELQPRACFEYVVAGNGNMYGVNLPAEALWDFRSRLYQNLGLSQFEYALPKSDGGVLILVKEIVAPRYPIHASMDEALRVAKVIRTNTGLRVDVRPCFGPDDSIRAQIEFMAQYEHVILPGGGAGFVSMLVAHGTHVLLPPYPTEDLKFLKASCFARVSLLTLNNRMFVDNDVLTAIKFPPFLANCSNLAEYRDLDRESFTPLIRFT
jgi:hypothetical protein